MKTILTGRLALTALLAFCVTGCASTLKSMAGHMDSEGATRYASMSPEAFVKTRFYTEEIGVLDHLNDGLGKLNSALGKESSSARNRPSRPSVSPDGRMVASVAHYNDSNNYQLTQPRQNLQLYCEAARRGKWQTVQRFTNDPIAAAQSNLFDVYSETEFMTFEHLRRQNGDSGYVPAEAQLASSAAAIATRRAAAHNELIATAYGGRGFREALDAGAFGVFRCDEATSSWSVSVLPHEFYPPEDLSNQFDTPGALLVIKLFKEEEQRPQAADGVTEPN